MKKVMLSAAICLVIIEVVAYIFNSSSRFEWSGIDWSGFGLAQFGCAIFTFFLGLILVFIRATNEIGKGLLLGTAVAILIGLAVCSNIKIR